MNKIELKFEQKLYRVEMPDIEGFTGELDLIFHYKFGILKGAQVLKKGSIELSTNEDNRQKDINGV